MLAQRRRFVALAADFDLHPAQSGALLNMEADRALAMNELAAMLHCDNSNVTGLIDRLELRGLVRRLPDARDRRVTRVTLTADGVRLQGEIRARLREASQELQRLSPREQRQLADLLRRALAEEPAVRSMGTLEATRLPAG